MCVHAGAVIIVSCVLASLVCVCVCIVIMSEVCVHVCSDKEEFSTVCAS